MELSRTQVIEFFHVAFLDALSKTVDPARYILKGGANLRYFLDSVRYSEDIDLDMNGIDPWRLEQKVDKLLNGRALPILLRVGRVAIDDVLKHKNTETTQRWKIYVKAPGHAQPIRTRVEFSNRNDEDRYKLDVVPNRIVEPYALRAPSIQHYVEDAPTEQKIGALVERNTTQARDVFDLDLLFRLRPLLPGSIPKDTAEAAIERAMELSFSAYQDQVIPFLEPAALELYGDEAAWTGMQTFVAQKIEDAS